MTSWCGHVDPLYSVQSILHSHSARRPARSDLSCCPIHSRMHSVWKQWPHSNLVAHCPSCRCECDRARGSDQGCATPQGALKISVSLPRGHCENVRISLNLRVCPSTCVHLRRSASANPNHAHEHARRQDAGPSPRLPATLVRVQAT